MFRQEVMRSVSPAVMTCDRFPLPMNDYRLDALVVLHLHLRLSVHRQILVGEVIAHPITGKNIRRDHLRTEMPAGVPHDKAEHAILVRPEIRPRHGNRKARCPSRPAENKRVDAFRSGNAGVRQDPRTFFNNDARNGGASHEHDTKETSKRIETHKKSGFGTTAEESVVVFSKVRRQQFIRIYAKAPGIAENLGNRKIL